MVISGHSLTNSTLHQSGQRGEHVNRRINLLVVKGSINEDLSFGDISGKIGDGMGNIIIRHGKNGKLGDGSVNSLDSTGSFVDGGKIGIHITGVRSSTWDFFSGSRNFSEGISVRRHISQDDQNVEFSFVGQISSGFRGLGWIFTRQLSRQDGE
jgi:hypothetical protein